MNDKIKSPGRRFYGYLKKDSQLLYKRKKYLYVFLLLPLIIALIFLFALNPKSYEIKVGICDFDRSEISRNSYNSLDGFKPLLIEEENCTEELISQIKLSKLDLGLVVPEGFSNEIQNLRQASLVIYYDNTDIAFSNLVEWKVDNSLRPFKRQIVDSLNTEVNQRAKTIREGTEILFSISTISSRFDDRIEEIDSDLRKLENLQTEFLVDPIWTRKVSVYEEGLKKDAGVVFIFPLLALFITLMLASTSIIYDKNTNFITRVKSSSGVFSYLASKTIFFTILVAIQFVIILLLFMFYGGKYSLSPMNVIELILFVGIINSLIGLLIGLIAKSEGIAVLFSLMISFPLMLISGIFFPVQALPKVTQFFGNLMPLQYQINASKSVLLFGQNISNAWIFWALGLFILVWIMIRKD